MPKMTLSATDFARWLVIATMVGLMFSPPVANLAELLMVITMVFSREVRQLLMAVGRHRIVLWSLAFYATISVGVLYSVATHHEAVSMWGGWRKVLLLPIAYALFRDTPWKKRLVESLIVASTLAAIASYIGLLTHFAFPVPDPEPGILVRNHATQGMIFSVAAFAASIMAFPSHPISAGRRGLLIASALLLASNTIFVSTGRSGYIVILACAIASLVAFYASTQQSRLKLAGAAAAVVAMITLALAISPTASQRIKQGFDEARNYQQATEYTSMGIRMVFWENTIKMLQARPWLGYGTGGFRAGYQTYVENQTGFVAIKTSDPHNQFMKIAGEHGALGLGVFLGLLWACFRQRSPMPYRLLGLGVLSAWIMTSMVNSHFSTFAEGTFVYLWLGAMLSQEPPA